MQPLPPGFFSNYPLEIDWLEFLLRLIFLSVLIIGLYYLYRYLRQRFKKNPVILTPEKQRSLWQETYNLFTMDIPLDFKKYYFETSEALCAYLGFAKLTISEISAESFSESISFLQALRLAELVKFAKHIPTAEETTQYRQWSLTVLMAHQPMEEINV